MPTTQPNESVAPPATDKATPPAVSPAATRKSAPCAAKAPVRSVAASSNKPMPMPLAKPAVKTEKPTLTPAAKPAFSKLLKPKKIKLVRDSFTIPKLEYLMIDALKLRAEALGKSVRKSELIRAGIKALAAMPDRQFFAAVKALAPIKTGHPAKD